MVEQPKLETLYQDLCQKLKFFEDNFAKLLGENQDLQSQVATEKKKVSFLEEEVSRLSVQLS